jgi:hypothetical protein
MKRTTVHGLRAFCCMGRGSASVSMRNNFFRILFTSLGLG